MLQIFFATDGKNGGNRIHYTHWHSITTDWLKPIKYSILSLVNHMTIKLIKICTEEENRTPIHSYCCMPAKTAARFRIKMERWLSTIARRTMNLKCSKNWEWLIPCFDTFFTLRNCGITHTRHPRIMKTHTNARTHTECTQEADKIDWQPTHCIWWRSPQKSGSVLDRKIENYDGNDRERVKKTTSGTFERCSFKCCTTSRILSWILGGFVN